MRDGRELVRQTKPFTVERRAESWWHLLSTLTIFVAAFAIALSPLPWIPRLIAGIIAGLVHIRVFILYHDFEHGAILEGSRVAKLLLRAYGLLALAPPSIWKETHDHHHRNNARRIGIDTIGSYPILTTDEWQRASRGTRMFYRVSRHPLTIALGYLTVFMWGFCLVPLRRNPRRRLDALAALVIHFGLMAPLAFFWPAALLFGFFVPILVATALGSYLFYAQHNFPDAKLRFGEDWDYVFAALRSSSYIRTNPVMQWFTGNIGYHHVHHLNARIPFYRLPETMAAFKELQTPGTTSLSPREIIRCFRLKLWDPRLERFVTFREARRIARRGAEGGRRAFQPA